MNKVIISIVLAVAIMLLFSGNLVWGSVSIPYREVVGALTGNQTVSDTYGYIILESRLPQAITALLSGAALATSGLLLQTAFEILWLDRMFLESAVEQDWLLPSLC